MTIPSKKTQNIINHIALVLDESSSMTALTTTVVKVADAQIAYLAQRSKELDQETRITVYTFSDHVRCLIYDKDVLRLPSIRDLYRPKGMTALIDATLKSQEDLAQTWEGYGDHSFLTFVLTDGVENVSKRRPDQLVKYLTTMPENYTVAVLVPDQSSKFEAKKFGFPSDNIAIWDTSSAKGMSEAGDTIRTATDNYMSLRSTGVRSSTSLFTMSPAVVNKATVSATNLTPLAKDKYLLVPVINDIVIKPFIVDECGRKWSVGRYLYQLMKPETVQANKMVAVVEKKTAKVYLGDEARNLLGLPDENVRVRPEKNPEFDVFVQSTSNNRILKGSTKLLILE